MSGPSLEKENRNHKGFALIEAILAASLFSLIIATFAGALIYSQQNSLVTGNTFRATFLAQEGLETVRNLRDENFSNLTDGIHGLAIAGGVWHLQDAQDTIDIFRREVEISAIDANTKQVVSRVSWDGLFGQQHTVILTSYLTNWQPMAPKI